MWAPYRNNYVEKAFIRTADEDYVASRWSFFNGFFPSFIWLAGQSIEKYLKAILLVNDKPAKFGHELRRGATQFLKIYPEFVAQKFIKPENFPTGLWHDECFDDFLTRLDNFYCSDNRYGGWGHYVLPDDVVKADLVVWNIRRFARPRFVEVPMGSGKTEIDMHEHLKNNLEIWRLSNQNPVEKLVDGTRQNSEMTNTTFKILNFTFFPNDFVFPDGYISGSAMSALDLIEEEALKFSDRQGAYEALKWIRDNIKAGTELRKRINRILGD